MLNKVKVLNALGLLCLWQCFYAYRERVFRSRRRRKRAAAGKCAVAAQRNTSTRRSPCGDSEQCETLTENGKRCQGQIWQPLTLAGPFLEVQSLVGPALTSSSGRRLDQVSRKLLVSSNFITRPSLTGVATPASEQSKQHSVPPKETSAPEVPEDQDRAVTDHQLGVCPPDRQVPIFRSLSWFHMKGMYIRMFLRS